MGVGNSPLRDAGLFLVMTLALSWLLWIPGAILVVNGAVAVGNFLLALGSFVPLAVALYLNLWGRQATFDLKRWFGTLSLRSILVAAVLPVLILLPLIMLREYWGSFDILRFFSDLRSAPTLLLGLIVIAFGEEVGWRGFFLPRLQSLNLIVVNFIVAFAWFAWQIPLVFTQSGDAFGNDNMQQLAAFLLFSFLITPFFNRLTLHSNYNVLLPTLLRACVKTAFAIYALQGASDILFHPNGLGVLAWLAVLNIVLFGQLWLGKNPEESELDRVMPLEPAIK